MPPALPDDFPIPAEILPMPARRESAPPPALAPPHPGGAGSLASPAAILAAVRARGSDARDVRDAIHEAHHALTAGASWWDRDTIHTAVLARWSGRRGLPDRICNEIECRAAEWAVCDRFGIDYDPAHWTLIMCMEAIKDGVPALPYKTALSAVTDCRVTDGDRLLASVLTRLGFNADAAILAVAGGAK